MGTAERISALEKEEKSAQKEKNTIAKEKTVSSDRGWGCDFGCACKWRLMALIVFVPAIVCHIFGAVTFLVFAAFIVLALYAYASFSVLSDSTLSKDIASLRAAFGAAYMDALAKQFDAKQVCEYYTRTTDRDYGLLEAFVGPGLHTQLHAAQPNALLDTRLACCKGCPSIPITCACIHDVIKKPP